MIAAGADGYAFVCRRRHILPIHITLTRARIYKIALSYRYDAERMRARSHYGARVCLLLAAAIARATRTIRAMLPRHALPPYVSPIRAQRFHAAIRQDASAAPRLRHARLMLRHY